MPGRYTQRMAAKKKKLGIIIGAWDLAWKVVAIQHAARKRDWKWVGTLAGVSSAGILPIWYLWRELERERELELGADFEQ